jgi:hypothetical protein
MGQVIFWRRRRGLGRREAKHRVSAIAGSTDVGGVSDGRRWAARTHARELGQETGRRPIRHSHIRVNVRCPESSACHAFFPGLRTGHVTRRNFNFRCLVTLTLQRRNAKNIFAERTLRTTVAFSHPACNVAQSSAKFHKNPAVSDAVERLIDCMMLNKNPTIDSPFRPASARIVARSMPRGPGARAVGNEDGGAP